MMEEKQELFYTLLEDIHGIVRGEGNRDEKLMDICNLLKDKVSYYDWVGFYLVDDVEKELLVLGPFVGEPTEHKRITFGQGICGQAAALKKTFVAQDVRKETNYLSCSMKVLSEIVVPIFKGVTIAGELDIDSHEFSPFSDYDRVFLESICGAVGKIL
jgi:L-methionine (R)-S-oxide reductase